MELRFRQIHLDFHTSELITGIGDAFDPDEFADTLKKAYVNSVTCFARGHHGYIYYDTKKHPERRHPYLSRNLLAEQIEACHKRDIKVPIYITVQWDQFTAEQHPEWLVVEADGKIEGTPPFEAGFYRCLCVNSPYLDFLKEHTQEVLETLPTDGIFFDIVQAKDDSSKWTKMGMLAEGLEPSDKQQRVEYGRKAINEFKREMTAFVRKFNKDCTIFYNAGHVGVHTRPSKDAYTHFELESLPSGGWGYLHFPLSMRYARGLGKDCMGMTGKFHTAWGDFHSFKNQPALRYECLNMLALNAKCSIGDQLLPNGKICQDTYELVGSVYQEVAQKEEWCTAASAKTEIAIITTEEYNDAIISVPTDTAGALQILQEGKHQFDIVDFENDFSNYRLLILPDNVLLDEKQEEKLSTYLSNGGSLIASFRSGLNRDENAFVLPSMNINWKGPAPYSPDFIVPTGEIGKGLPATEHVIYYRGIEVEPLAGTEVLSEVAVPYFNRTYKHFCSHRHTPSSGQIGYPGVLKSGKVIYFTHPIFSLYRKMSPRWCKQLVLNAVDILMPDPLIQITAPASLHATVNAQKDKNRWVLHLLYFVPERRGEEFDTIEDVVPLFNLPISLRTEMKVKQVRTVPEMESITFAEQDGRIEFTLPKLDGHQMIEIDF